MTRIANEYTGEDITKGYTVVSHCVSAADCTEQKPLGLANHNFQRENTSAVVFHTSWTCNTPWKLPLKPPDMYANPQCHVWSFAPASYMLS